MYRYVITGVAAGALCIVSVWGALMAIGQVGVPGKTPTEPLTDPDAALTEAPALFDRPDPAPLAQAIRHDAEDHEEAPAQAGDLGGDDGVVACDALEFFAEFALVKMFHAACGLNDPVINVDRRILVGAKILDSEHLVFNRLLSSADSDITQIHNQSFFLFFRRCTYEDYTHESFLWRELQDPG